MRLHPYIFKIIKDGEIMFFQGTLKGVKSFCPDKIIEVRINRDFKGKAVRYYYYSLPKIEMETLKN